MTMAKHHGIGRWTDLSYESHWMNDLDDPPELPELPREWGAWDCEDNDTGELRGPRRATMHEWGPYLQDPSPAEEAWLEEQAYLKALEENPDVLPGIPGVVGPCPLRRLVTRGDAGPSVLSPPSRRSWRDFLLRVHARLALASA